MQAEKLKTNIRTKGFTSKAVSKWVPSEKYALGSNDQIFDCVH